MALGCQASEPTTRGLDGFELGESGVFKADLEKVAVQVDPHGMVVHKNDERWRLQTVAWGRPGEERVRHSSEPNWGSCLPMSERCRVEAISDGLTEFWQPTSGRIEHGWTLSERPLGDGPVSLQLAIEGADNWRVDADGLGATIAHQTATWRYQELAVYGADGASLTAWMASTASGLAVVFDDTGATYPVEVDPVLSEVARFFELEAPGYFRLGHDVAGAGDVNGDGFADVLVGAPNRSPDDESVAVGAAYVYIGGLEVESVPVMLTASDGMPGDEFGTAVSGVGDVNGDGFDDVIVGAPDEADENGAAYVYVGSTDGLLLASETKLVEASGRAGERFGGSVSGAGDVNGDGYDDILVGTEGSWSDTAIGLAHLYLGGPDGIAPSVCSNAQRRGSSP